MKREKFYRWPGEDGAGAGVANDFDYKKGFESLSDPNEIVVEEEETPVSNPDLTDDDVVAPVEKTLADKTTEEKKGVVEKTEEAPAPIIDKDGNQVDDKGAIVKTKEELEAEASIIDEFKIPGVEDAEKTTKTKEELERETAIKSLQTDQSWKALAKVRGIEIPEDSFEAYDKGLNEAFSVEKAAIAAAAKKEGYDLKFDEFPVDAVMIIEGVKSGKTVEQILAPIKELEKLEVLSNAELIAEDLRLQGWEQEAIDKHIADLTEKDRIIVEAQPLRVFIKNQKEIIAKEQAENYAQMQQAREVREANARIKESEEIKSALVSMGKFMDVPITDKVVDHIQKKWNAGEYHEAFKDPKVISEFLIYKEFGEQGVKNLRNREYQRGRDEKTKKLHNIPVIDTGGTGAVAKKGNAVKAEGNFAALPEN